MAWAPLRAFKLWGGGVGGEGEKEEEGEGESHHDSSGVIHEKMAIRKSTTRESP